MSQATPRNVVELPTAPARHSRLEQPEPAPTAARARPRALGKFLYVGDEKLYVRGVTYGTFAPNERGEHVHDRARVERDFAQIAASGFNAVRTYTVPERWVLDAAAGHGLWVMVGIPWEQHVAFLDAPGARAIEERVRDAVRSCAGHRAVLCYAVGNEIPAPIVRWYGPRRIERFIARLCEIVRAEDAGALVTYVNYPTTEYLSLPFLDLICFNVYLEAQERLDAYLARLQNVAGERPLVIAEIGLDSRRNGEAAQAAVLDWQLRSTFAAGCAGAFVFAWTDEWHRGGFDVDDWDFGLTRRDRQPKPALAAVGEVMNGLPFPNRTAWPHVTVVVCAYNAEATIRECLAGLGRVRYPAFDVVVVDDGSTDRTAAFAAEYGVRLIRTPNRGLSSARNTGLEAATGQIVAYLDSDAFPDPDWLHYLAAAFDAGDVGVGGPNLAPPGGSAVAECFDHAPGGPTHVLLSDRVAEHIPGCNMAFRKAALDAIGGFDPALRIAGDDVDICWRLQERGGRLGFAPGAVVWHHRRTTIGSYWKQQRGYGRAEALLERKWPEKYNDLGHLTWGGRIYAKGLTRALGFRTSRLYGGIWGTAPFQHVEDSRAGTFAALAVMPEWYLVIALLGLTAALGVFWRPLSPALPLFGAAAALPLVKAAEAARGAVLRAAPSPLAAARSRALIAFLHFSQPPARLYGRLEYGLTLARRPVSQRLSAARPRQRTVWSERRRDAPAWLESLSGALGRDGASARAGGEYDRWDLEAAGGALGSARLLAAVEEHGAGRQLIRLRMWPRCSPAALGLGATLTALAASAAFARAWIPFGILAVPAAATVLRTLQECAGAMQRLDAAVGVLEHATAHDGAV